MFSEKGLGPKIWNFFLKRSKNYLLFQNLQNSLNYGTYLNANATCSNTHVTHITKILELHSYPQSEYVLITKLTSNVSKDIQFQQRKQRV